MGNRIAAWGALAALAFGLGSGTALAEKPTV